MGASEGGGLCAICMPTRVPRLGCCCSLLLLAALTPLPILLRLQAAG